MRKAEIDLTPIERLLAIMERLRDPVSGCPWDREQDFASIAPHTLEEAYEVVDAIEHGAHGELCSELGDLLFQIIFYARIAQERGWFDFCDVARAIGDKLVQRHPHVFAAAAATPVDPSSWEALKREERRRDGKVGVLADVPLALPALSRAAKLGRRAAAVGFDWPDRTAVRAKVNEELAETDAAIAEGDAAAMDHEIGDLLLAVANLARHLGVEPEGSLRRANRRFERRFRRVEAAVEATPGGWVAQTPAALDALWHQAKRAEVDES